VAAHPMKGVMSSVPVMLAAVLPLLLWVWFQSATGCWPGFLLMLPVLGLISLNMLESALLRRRALAGMYLRPDSFVARWLCRRTWLMIWQVTKALVLVLLLFVEATAWPPWLWVVLLLDLLLFPFLYALLRRWLTPQLQAGRRDILARQLLVIVNTLLLILVITTGRMAQPRPDYSSLDWQEAATHASEQTRVGCELIAPLARLAALRDALLERLVAESVTLSHSMWLGLLGWLLYFFWSGLVFWALSRLLSAGLGLRHTLAYLLDESCG
jgi:hypothetical protein